MKYFLAVCCLFALVACGGGGSGVTDHRFRLAGKLVVVNPADADVTISVGDVTATAKADADGVFNFDVQLSPEALSLGVALLGKLGGERAFIELGSSLGSAEELIAMSGPDGTLDFDDSPRVNISPLTTAEFALLDKVRGGSTKVFDFADGVDPNEALTLAATIQLIILDPLNVPLPAGNLTTLEFARDEDNRQAVIADLEQNNPDALEGARQQILDNPDIVAPPATAGPEIFKLGDMQAARRICWNGCPASQGVDFNADGTAQAYNSFSSLAASWSLNGTRRELRYTEPESFTSFPFGDCDGDGTGEQYQETQTSEGLDLVEVGGDAVSVTDLLRLENDCSAIPSRSLRFTRVFNRLDNLITAFGADDFAGRDWAVDVLDLPVTQGQGLPEIDDAIKSDLVSFAVDGSSQNLILGSGQQWSLQGGVLQLEQAGVFSGSLERIEALDAVAEIVLASYEVDGKKYLHLGYAYRGDPAVVFDAQNSAGTYYWNGIGADQVGDEPPDDDPRLLGDRFVLFADGNGEGYQGDEIVDGEVSTGTSSFKIADWQVDGRELRYGRYRDFENGSPVMPCDPATPTCQKYFDIRAVLVNRQGARLYTIRRRDTFFGADFTQAEPTATGRYQISQILDFEPATQ